MGVQWTKEQQEVIRLRDRNILVSAAAGSGKTAVLVERILSKITDKEHPVDIDSLPDSVKLLSIADWILRFCYLLGIIIAAMIYAQIPAPPKQVRITHARRTNVGSISKYSAIPPHTPQSILFSDDLYKRLSPMSISSLNPD